MPPIHRALSPLLLAPYAAAQEAAPLATPVPQVEIKGNPLAYDARRDDTATKIVINQDELLKYGDSNIADVLKRLPGITIEGVPGRGGEIRMRGLGNGYTQILLNGEPSPPGFTLDALAPELIERIEIMRAATADYSTQAIAGTINVVLKRAIVKAQRDIKVGVRSEHGQPGTNPQFQVSDRAGIYSYAVAGGLFSASGYLRRITDNVRNSIFLVDGAWVSMPVNTGSAKAHGIELEAKFGLRAWSKTAPNLDLRANLARNWSTLASVPGPNNRLVSQTPISATLGFDYQADRLPVSLGASYNFQNGGPVRFSANEFDYASPKRVLDLYALVKFNARRQLRLSVGNVLHQDYMTATTWVDRTGALSDAVFTPAPTLFWAALEVKL